MLKGDNTSDIVMRDQFVQEETFEDCYATCAVRFISITKSLLWDRSLQVYDLQYASPQNSDDCYLLQKRQLGLAK